MKKIKIDIKKELAEEEFKTLVDMCKQEFSQKETVAEIALLCEEKTKEITPATETYVLFMEPENQTVHIPTLQKNIPVNFSEESILSECYTTGQPLLVNDATRSFLYHEKIDNFLDIEIKDLLLIPIIDDSAKKHVMAIIWASTLKGNWNQFTQKDLDYMSRFSILVKHFLLGGKEVSENTDKDPGLQDCMQMYDTLKAVMRREQEYFAAIIHDIRTPMNAVMGFLELLSLQEFDTQKKEYIDTAIRSGESMVALINDALDISKIASGKMSIEKIAFSPLEEFSDIAKLFFNTAKKKNITFTAYYDPSMPKTITSDYHRIKQIVNNLLSNAVKFTPENGKITLSLTYDKEKDGLTFSVEDSGIGIAKDKQKDIFTPYTQEKSSTSRKYGGTGLGLSISQQLAVLLGGKLQLESEEGKGSRFYFTIPCNTSAKTPPSLDADVFNKLSFKIYSPQKHHHAIDVIKKYLDYFNTEKTFFSSPKTFKKLADESFDTLIIFKEDAIKHDIDVQHILDKGKSALIIGDTFLNDGCRFTGNIQRLNTPLLPQDILHSVQNLKGEKQEKTTSKIQQKKFKNKHILVVDDNVINLKFMKEVLKTQGIKTLLAQNGQEGLTILDTAEKVDLVFMDENMPGMQGEEAISRIRQKEKEKGFPHTAIIGLTGDADDKTRQKLLDSGADDVLTKPVNLQEIIQVITKHLQ